MTLRLRSCPKEAIIEALPRRDEEVSDAALVARARGRDSWALEMLYRRHVQVVAGTALRLLRNHADAEDVAQETFLIAFEKLAQLSEPAAFRGWLVRIAVSRVHRRLRARSVRAFLLPWHEPVVEEAGLEHEARAGASPEQLAELALLDRAVASLPLRMRTPWLLRRVMGCALEETAEACGCSLATVKRRIAAADVVVGTHTGVRHDDTE